MNTITKQELIRQLQNIRAQGWIVNNRSNNDGGAGNTLEDLLGITENNLPIPNAGEWELKCQIKTHSLLTLFHCEPSPRAIRFVPKVLLPHYGWAHEQAGEKYPSNEKSFRQTINTLKFSNRGFKVKHNTADKKIEIIFNPDKIDPLHAQWAARIANNPESSMPTVPYWGFNDLLGKLSNKLHNCFYVLADKKKEGGVNKLRYEKIFMLENLSIDKFSQCVGDGHVYVDFDARSGHNHGTKFRIKQSHFINLYENAMEIPE